MPLFKNPHGERPIRDVPPLMLLLLATLLVLQVAWQATRPPRVATAADLPSPPPPEKLMLLSLGDHVALSRALMLWLQSFDNQPGISIPYRALDYRKLTLWLEDILVLDSKGQYPLFAASHLYSEVADESRQRQMLEFVHLKFLEDSDRRWPALAQAVYVAKHRLRDLPLALSYARALTEQATAGKVPFRAGELQAWVLEDMGELEDARILLGGLRASGALTDPHELQFLQQRLRMMDPQTGK